MPTLPSFAGPTSARSVTRTVRMRFSVGTALDPVPRRPLHLADDLGGVRPPQRRPLLLIRVVAHELSVARLAHPLEGQPVVGAHDEAFRYPNRFASAEA